MLSIEELTIFLINHDADFELIPHESPIISTNDASKYFDIKKASPTFIVDTEQGLVAFIVGSWRGRLNFRELCPTMGFSKLKMADKDKIYDTMGCSIGAIPLVGHGRPCVFDKNLLHYDYIFGGSGDPWHTLKIAPNDVIRLNAVIRYIE